MRAIQIQAHPDGSQPTVEHPATPSSLRLSTTVPTPTPPTGTLLVRVRAANVTRDSLLWSVNYVTAANEPKERSIPGHDYVGEVAALGPDAPAGFAVGDKVYGRVHADVGATWAEFAVAGVDEAAHLPAAVDLLEAATIPTSALTAWQGLFVHAGLPALEDQVPAQGSSADLASAPKDGRRILITGATGAVGLFAVQLARLAGLHVVAVTSAAKDTETQELLRGLGADEIVPSTQSVARDGIHIVLDTVGGSVLESAWDVVRPDGRILSIATSEYFFAEQHAARADLGGRKPGVRAKWFLLWNSQAELERIAQLLVAGALRTFVAGAFPLEEAREAYEIANSRRSKLGKVVLTV